jgi:hypothetical protein
MHGLHDLSGQHSQLGGDGQLTELNGNHDNKNDEYQEMTHVEGSLQRNTSSLS